MYYVYYGNDEWKVFENRYDAEDFAEEHDGIACDACGDPIC